MVSKEDGVDFKGSSKGSPPPHFKGPEGRHEDVWRKASTRRAFTVLACLNNGVHTRLANMGVWRRVIELGTHLGNRTSVFIEPIAPKE